MTIAYIGVDVGTESVRAALVSANGKIEQTAQASLTINKPKPDYFEQSSQEIWQKCCHLIKKITQGITPDCVRGIGFDATCSLVVLDDNYNPVSISPDEKGNSGNVFDVIMWMDHRAKAQADKINSESHSVLKYIGGKISLEMQPPKLMWIKQNLPEQWNQATHFFDLPDFLTFKATNSLSRSSCSLVSKWTYSAHDGWDKDFWTKIGLDEIVNNNFYNIGPVVLPPGDPVGEGLTSKAAAEMVLQPHTPVGASLIDAHCGGIGTIGVNVSDTKLPCVNKPLTERIAIICGTSSCHMAISQNPLFVPGIWGPYYSNMVPDLWSNEGGQSAAGKLIDHIVQCHPASSQLKELSESRNQHIYECLNNLLNEKARSLKLTSCEVLTKDLHVWPDFHGNRSPIADSSLCGAICGLTLDSGLNDLAKLYLATLQALASGSLHILDRLEKYGHKISTVFMCGGLSKNPLFVQVHSNVLKRPVVLGKEKETVLLGGAILGALAAKDFPSFQSAMGHMCKIGEVVNSNKDLDDFYRKKHQVFLTMLRNQMEYRDIMES